LIDYTDSAAITITLGKDGALTVGIGGEAEGDRIKNAENIYATIFDDFLTGNNLANLLEGVDGNDTVSGGGGNDRLFGEDGNDTLNGGAGNDFLEGDSGAAGNDTQTGGTGNDTFIFFGSFGLDTITDFKAGAGLGDKISFDDAVFSDFAVVQAASAQVGADVVITKDASNNITLKNVLLANLNADDFMFF
jgi:Ca2+-binding RTX toxin-like protein